MQRCNSGSFVHVKFYSVLISDRKSCYFVRYVTDNAFTNRGFQFFVKMSENLIKVSLSSETPVLSFQCKFESERLCASFASSIGRIKLELGLGFNAPSTCWHESNLH